jgi:hypothetical protein
MSEADKQPLSYERPPASPIPRWQFRLLFLLVLINLAVTLQLAYAPGITTAFKQWWEEQKATRQMQALQRQAWNRTEPAGKIAWDENPETAAKLLAGPGYKTVQVPRSVAINFPALSNWPRSAGAEPPAVAGQLIRNFPISQNRVIPSREDFGFVFLHGLKSPAGEERLVYVIVEGQTG